MLALMCWATLVPAADPNDMTSIFQQNVEAKRQGLAEIRNRLIAHPTYTSPDTKNVKKVQDFFSHLSETGEFDDLPGKPSAHWNKATFRLNAMTGAFKRMTPAQQNELRPKLYAGILNYFRQMVAKPDPFVGAAFESTRNASAIYYMLFDEWQKPENQAIARALKDSLFMCWYWPIFHGDTHRRDNPNSLNVFLGEGHFIVGNTTYRPIVECAAALDNTQMMDVVREITVRSLANRTSYQTESTSLWGEMGLTMDGAGMAHGRQNYIFGYVRDWFNGVTSIAKIFHGTPWEIPSTSWNLTTDLVLDGQQWFVYKGDIDWSVAGRHNVYPGAIADGNSILKNGIRQMLDLGGDSLKRKPELLALSERLEHMEEFSGNRYFWNTEDMIHRRGNYYMSVNLSSVRSNGPENAPPSSLVNYQMGFGSMMIKTKGDEYLRSRGAMNYSALPGITSLPKVPPTRATNWSGFHGGNSFAGGVSDGNMGVCGFVLNHEPLESLDQQLWRLKGLKSYFFFDEGCIALGSGVTTGAVETTVNQTEWRGDARYWDGKTVAEIGKQGVNQILPHDRNCWVLNDGIGYILLAGASNGDGRLVAEIRTTHWSELAELNASKPDAAPAPVPIFQLSLTHPQKHDQYAYAILPNANEEMLTSWVINPPFEILASRSAVQAVRHSKSGIIQAVYFQAGEINCGGFWLAVDRPAILMLRPGEGGYQVFYSDPLQIEDARTLHISVRTAAASGGRSVTECEFPAKPWIGKTAQTKLSVIPANQ